MVMALKDSPNYATWKNEAHHYAMRFSITMNLILQCGF